MREPESLNHCIAEWGFHQRAAVIPAPHMKCERPNTELRQSIAEPQSVQNTRGIWADLNSRADLTQGVGLFVDMNIEPGAQQ
jgi:hypothetical protein